MDMGMNMTSLMSMLTRLTPEERARLFASLGIADEDDLLLYLSPKSEEDLYLDYAEYRAHKILFLYLPPIILVLGTFGNIFSFIILRNKAMTRQSTHMFLAALSVADSLVLFVGLLRQWIGELTGLDIKHQATWLCKVTVTLGYICSDTSVWLIVAVTIERFVVVCYPLKANALCSSLRAKRTIVGTLVFFVLINVHFLRTVDINVHKFGLRSVKKCEAAAGFETLVSIVWPWVDALIYFFAPFVLISVFNVIIIARVLVSTSGRAKLKNGGSKIRRYASDRNTRLTLMLLTVSFAFVITTLPMNFCIIAAPFWNQHSNDLAVMAKARLVRTISELLMYVNHSINFFLYCAMGQKFRNEMMRMFCKKNNSALLNTDHSQHLYCSRNCSSSHHVDVEQKMICETNV